MHYVRKIEFQLSSRAFPTHNEHRFQLCIGLKSISSSASNDAQTPRPRAIINLSHQSNESVVSSVERQSWGVCIIFGYVAFVSFKSLGRELIFRQPQEKTKSEIRNLMRAIRHVLFYVRTHTLGRDVVDL